MWRAFKSQIAGYFAGMYNNTNNAGWLFTDHVIA